MSAVYSGVDYNLYADFIDEKKSPVRSDREKNAISFVSVSSYQRY